MKMRNIIKNTYTKLSLLFLLLFSAVSCEKDLEPFDSKTEETALGSPEDFQTATYCAYAGSVNASYARIQHFLLEFPGDNIALSGTTGDALYNICNYSAFPGNPHTDAFWRQSSKTIYSR